MDILMNMSGVVLEGGKLKLTDSRATSLAQRLSNRLQTFFGSWFLNTLLGIDYFNKVFEKTVTKASIDVVFQTEIYKDPRVEKIEGFHSKLENNTYTMSFSAKAKEGFVSDLISVRVTGGTISINVGE